MLGVASASVSASTVTRYCSEQRLAEPAAVPLLGPLGVGQELGHGPLERRLDHLPRLGLELLAALEREQPQRVDHLALLVHHVVVLEQPLALLEVLQLDALLRLLDGARDQAAVSTSPSSAPLLSISARCGPTRTAASGRLRATGRNATAPGSP